MSGKKQLTQRQEALIEALIGQAKGDVRVAMDLAGYSKTTTIREAITPIRDEVIDAATLVIAMNAPKAASEMVGVLSAPQALGARNTIAAAKEVLDRAGVIKTEKVEITNPNGGMFILPPKKPAED
jgi:hypothetical protein